MPYGTALGIAGSGKSWTPTRTGSPRGCQSRPLFLYPRGFSDEFLLFRVDADHRVAGLEVPAGGVVDVPELGVPVRVLLALDRPLALPCKL